MGSGKWVLGIFVAILLVVVLCYPGETLFLLKFVGQIILINLQPWYDLIVKHLPFH